jgi:uncharacterized protein (DUF3084 family)
MTQEDLWKLLLSLASAVSVAILGWKNYRLQARTSLFDDLKELVETYREEVKRHKEEKAQLAEEKAQLTTERKALQQERARLAAECDELQRQLFWAQKQALSAKHQAVCYLERLEIERRLFEQKLRRAIQQARAPGPEPEEKQQS